MLNQSITIEHKQEKWEGNFNTDHSLKIIHTWPANAFRVSETMPMNTIFYKPFQKLSQNTSLVKRLSNGTWESSICTNHHLRHEMTWSTARWQCDSQDQVPHYSLGSRWFTALTLMDRHQGMALNFDKHFYIHIPTNTFLYYSCIFSHMLFFFPYTFFMLHALKFLLSLWKHQVPELSVVKGALRRKAQLLRLKGPKARQGKARQGEAR